MAEPKKRSFAPPPDWSPEARALFAVLTDWILVELGAERRARGVQLDSESLDAIDRLMVDYVADLVEAVRSGVVPAAHEPRALVAQFVGAVAARWFVTPADRRKAFRVVN